MKCSNNCWECSYDGCINITREDFIRQNKFDKEETNQRKPVSASATSRYNRSEKAKACKKRYLQSEKGKIANRKNATSSYQRNKEHYQEYRRLWYQENRERISERRKRMYQRNREEILNKTRKYKAFMGWRQRFIAKNNREPILEEVSIWEHKYADKRRKKEKDFC